MNEKKKKKERKKERKKENQDKKQQQKLKWPTRAMVAYYWKVVALRQISMLFFRKTVTLGAVCSPEG